MPAEILLTLSPLGASLVLSILKGVLMALFVITCLLLVLVILIQEGKGGGIAGAFGGAAAETFGVKAGSVNRFTAYLATAFVALALLHAGVAKQVSDSVWGNTPTTPPASDADMGPGPGATPVVPEGTGAGGAPPPDETPMGEAPMGDAPMDGAPMGDTPPPAPPGDAPMDGAPMDGAPPAPPAPPAMDEAPPAPMGEAR